MVSISEPGQSRARALVGVTAMFLVLPWPFVALRLWARRIKKMDWCFNDYAIIVGAVLASGFNINMIVDTICGGNGQHSWELTPSEEKVAAKSDFVSTVLWPSANTCVKLSILHFYKQVFRNKALTICAYVIAAMVLGYWVGTFVTAFTICIPINKQWDSTVEGHCGNMHDYYLSTAIINLLLDVMILVLPMPILWRLQMSIKKKVSLTFVFGLGAGICVVSIIRVISIATLNDTNLYGDGVIDGITSCLEPTLGVINACLPLLLPVTAKFAAHPSYVWVKSKASSMSSKIRLLSSHRDSKNLGKASEQAQGWDDSTNNTSPTTARNSRWHRMIRGRDQQIMVTNDYTVEKSDETDEASSHEADESRRTSHSRTQAEQTEAYHV